MIPAPPCPDHTLLCQRIIVSFRLEQMQCSDGTTYCGADANGIVPACCNDIGIREIVNRCGGNLDCVDYYANSVTIFPSLVVSSDTVSIDSLDRFFVDGLSGGVAFAFPMLASLFFILLVAYIFVSAVKNS